MVLIDVVAGDYRQDDVAEESVATALVVHVGDDGGGGEVCFVVGVDEGKRRQSQESGRANAFLDATEKRVHGTELNFRYVMEYSIHFQLD